MILSSHDEKHVLPLIVKLAHGLKEVMIIIKEMLSVIEVMLFVELFLKEKETIIEETKPYLLLLQVKQA